MKRQLIEATKEAKGISKWLSSLLATVTFFADGIDEFGVINFAPSREYNTSEIKDFRSKSKSNQFACIEVEKWAPGDTKRSKRGMFAVLWEKQVKGLIPWSQIVDESELDRYYDL